MSSKTFAKSLIVAVLGWQVRRLQKKNSFKVVAVSGSVGKTSTKFAMSQVLSAARKVRFQEGNYNDHASVPLIFFGLSLPSLMNPLAWLKTFWLIESQLRQPYPYEIVVVELGTDGPGQIASFAKFLDVDLALVTAIAPEHMEFFKDLDAVAKEELSVAKFSEHILINADLCDQKYSQLLHLEPITYGQEKPADYQIKDMKLGQKSSSFSIIRNNNIVWKGEHNSIALVQLYSIAAAVAVADQMGLSPEEIAAGVSRISPISGRMQLLSGINNSTILDDTYNASPDAVKAAIDTLYQLPAPQKIAILGNMNELGNYSQRAHTEIGEYCDPKQIDHVFTLGKDANKYLAQAAKARGCQVEEFSNPYALGLRLKEVIRPNAVILAKGSQNGVFAEEAVKEILANPKDAGRLVRQSPAWQKKKQESFNV